MCPAGDSKPDRRVGLGGTDIYARMKHVALELKTTTHGTHNYLNRTAN